MFYIFSESIRSEHKYCLGEYWLAPLLLFALSFAHGTLAAPVTKHKNAHCSKSQLQESQKLKVLNNTPKYLNAEVRTVVHDRALRSAGGPHDFYSEGDYWWPNLKNPEGPYIRRDGESNPDNFVAHRQSLMRLGDIIGSLSSAYLVEPHREKKQAIITAISRHLHAWFVSPKTRMSPNLLYAQAIKGRYTGRSIGLIDGIHLSEVALAIHILAKHRALDASLTEALKQWFSHFSHWLHTHPYGIKEQHHPNNHSIAWSLQMAAYAKLTQNKTLMATVRKHFKTWYLPKMMARDGSFPKETARTKPYGYSLFVLDLMAGIAQLASTPQENLWHYRSENGNSLRRGVEFMLPFIVNKQSWTFPKDIQYWADWPMQQAALLFAAYQLNDCRYAAAVESRPSETEIYEVKRNLPIRHPILWLNLDRG